MKKLHPRYQNDEGEAGGIVYSSEREEDKQEEEIDPRWDKLKKLK
jgi:uncharacterized metal-binding protein YceD (DUF177 family)